VPEEDWIDGPTEGQQLAVPEEGLAPHYSRQTKTVLRRWRDRKGKLYTDYIVSTFTHLKAAGIATLYDGRAGMESDMKGDKRGLGIEKRRKKSFPAQEAVVLLSQLAHNLLVWFKRHFLGGTAAQKLGVERLVREVLAMPAQARVGRRGRVRLRLPRLHPWAGAVAEGVAARFPPSGWRAIWRGN
jgi:Transposase DDE domain group 1